MMVCKELSVHPETLCKSFLNPPRYLTEAFPALSASHSVCYSQCQGMDPAWLDELFLMEAALSLKQFNADGYGRQWRHFTSGQQMSDLIHSGC